MYTVNAQESDRNTVTTEGAAPGGYTPRHTHDWEHEVYILRGAGDLVTDQGSIPLTPDQAILIAPGESHQFRCTGENDLEMLCIVPNGPATAGH